MDFPRVNRRAPRVAITAIALAHGLVSSAGGVERAPDYVMFNGKISTVDAGDSVVEAIAIRDGEILAVGPSARLRELAGAGTQMLDLEGRRVLPGLIDGHLHGLRQGYHCFSRSVRLDATYSRAQALAKFAARGKALPHEAWIVSHGGWTPEQFTDNGAMLTKAELDKALPDNPTYVRFLTYDGVLVNQKALDVLNLPLDTPGLVVVDGKPTGQLKMPPRDAKDLDAWAMSIAGRAIEQQYDALTIDDQAACLGDFIAEMNSLGLTSWVDPDGNQQPFNLVDGGCRSFARGRYGRQAVQELRRRGQLNARIGFYVTPPFFNGLDTMKDDPRLELSGLGDDNLRLIGFGEELMCPGNRAHSASAGYQDVVNTLATNRANFKNHASRVRYSAFESRWSER